MNAPEWQERPYSVMEPFISGRIRLKNRIVRLPHGTGKLAKGSYNDRWSNFHLQYAYKGVAMTIFEACSVHPSTPGYVKLWGTGPSRAVETLVSEAHAQDMKLIQQLWHAGAHGVPLDGSPSWAPSTIPSPVTRHPVEAMSLFQIDELRQAFVAAAVDCASMGFDGIELHAGHGYLFHQFLSARTNLRTDEYGFGVDARRKFLDDVVTQIRAVVPQNFIVGVRVSMSAFWEDDQYTDDMRYHVQALDALGVIDYLSLSQGSHHRRDQMIGGRFQPLGYQLELAKEFTNLVNTPTMAAGRITSIEQAQEVVDSGAAALVGMARSLIADPNLIEKFITKRAHTIRPCLACNEGCIGGIQAGIVSCVVNPDIPFGLSRAVSCSESHQHALVIGGGPAGLEVAWRLADAGLSIDLYERGSDVGGQLRHVDDLSGFHELGLYRDWLLAQCLDRGVRFHLDTEFSVDDVATTDADLIVVAVGGVESRRPDAMAPEVTTPVDIALVSVDELFALTDLQLGRVLVVDRVDDYVTAAVLTKAVSQASTVTVVSVDSTLLASLDGYFQGNDYRQALGSSVTFLPSARVVSWEGPRPVITSANQLRVLDPVDSIIVVDSRSPHPWSQERPTDTVPLYFVGESRGVTSLKAVIRDAQNIANRIVSVNSVRA